MALYLRDALHDVDPPPQSVEVLHLQRRDLTPVQPGVGQEPDHLRVARRRQRHVMAYDNGEVREQFSICFTARLLGGELQTSSES